MDLLKDITDGLRGGEDETNANDRDDFDRDAPPLRATGAASDRGPSAERSTETGQSSTESAPDDAPRDDEHVCRFCGTAFDADRTVCPDCDAEIVLRGAR